MYASCPAHELKLFPPPASNYVAAGPEALYNGAGNFTSFLLQTNNGNSIVDTFNDQLDLNEDGFKDLILSLRDNDSDPTSELEVLVADDQFYTTAGTKVLNTRVVSLSIAEFDGDGYKDVIFQSTKIRFWTPQF